MIMEKNIYLLLKEITIVNDVKIMYIFVICRWKNNTLMLINNFILPFVTGGIVMGISIVLSFLQVSCHQLLCYWIIIKQTFLF
jgi:hypothetical protein